MGNSFIGFPVPRAKIADMIAGAAPPLIHHTDHENGGADEVDCTGLAGAGGISLPFDDLFWTTWFESLDGFDQTLSGTGAISLSRSHVELATGATAGSSARLDKYTDYPVPALSWNKAQQLKTKMWLRSNTSNVCDAWIQRGNIGTNKHIGFKVTGGKLYGTIGNGSVETTLELETLGASNYTEERELIAKFSPGAECRFYVDSVDKGAIATNLPGGLAYSDYLAYLKLENPGVAETKFLLISMFQFWQEA